MQRNTVQRQTVLAAIRQLANHPSAETVYTAVHATDPRISKATVYRILKEEAVCGEVSCVDVPRDVNRYDHRTDSHWHIRCRVCGKIADVEIGEGGSPDMGVRPEGWNVEQVILMFSGLCGECAKNEERNQ